MNPSKYLLLNPGIQHNVKAIIRMKMLKAKIEKEINNSSADYRLKKQIKFLDEKIKVNFDLIKKYTENSYSDVQFETMQEDIDELYECLEDKYDTNKSFKENYYKALEKIEESELEQNKKDNENINETIDKSNVNTIKNTNGNNMDEEYIYEEDKNSIKYSIKNNTYEIIDEAVISSLPMNLYYMNEEEKKALYGEDYEDIFKDIDEEKIKYQDSRLLFFLWQKMGKNVAREYLEEFSKGKKANKNNMSYNMLYDMKKIKEDTTLSKDEKKYLMKMVKENKRVATIKYDRNRIWKRVIAAGTAIVLAMGATAKLVSREKIGQLDKGTNSNSNNEINNASDNKNKILNFTDRYKLTEEQKEQYTESKQESETEKENLKEKIEQLKLGDVLSLKEGFNYAENSLGQGQKGEIGNIPWRPAGEYEINGVSIIDSNNKIVTYAFDKEGLNIKEYIENNLPENGKIAFHVNYLKDEKKNPTGWIVGDEIYEALREQNAEIVNER